MTKQYNLKKIRTLLTEGFTTEELHRLCFDSPDLRPVCDQITPNDSKAKIIDKLVEYTDRKLKFEILLALAKEYNPTRYKTHQPYDDVTTTTSSGIHRKSQSSPQVNRIIPPPPPGYEGLEEIGKGGFGTVFKTKRSGTTQVVALKQFEANLFRVNEREEARQRFLRGARIMERLDHPHIPKIFEINTDENYFVMEFAPGGSLPSFYENRTKLEQNISFPTRIEMALQLCEAVSYAHGQGVLHRDISPPNVLVDDSQEPTPRLLLSDFDLAFQRGRTQLTGREWNWRYYLPRDLREELDRLERLDLSNKFILMKLTRPGIEADLYSLAMVILYLFVTFEPGPEGVMAEINRLQQIGQEEQWCSKAHLKHLAETLKRALHPTAEKRFTSAEQLRRQLAYLLPPRYGHDEGPMVLIKGGPFFMGSDDDRFPDENPRHLVCISSFYLDRYPVTNADFKRFLDDEANAEWRPGSRVAQERADEYYLAHWNGLDSPPEGLQDHPVVHVSWHAAYAYAAWAGKRLPTEAEWEYAARANTETVYWWGNKPDPQKANFFQTRQRSTTPVNNYSPNAWELFDMLGNVAEWCSDWYARDYYQRGNDHNPHGLGDGDERVLRGGTFNSVADEIRCSARSKAGPKMCSAAIGFRCAKSASTQ